MDLERHVAMLAEWLDGVDVVTAPARIADALERNANRGAVVGLATDVDLRRLASHEAAHVTIAASTGLRPGRVCIRADGSGSAAYEAIDDDLHSKFAMVLTHLAGVSFELMCGASGDHARRFGLRHSYDVLAARCDADACRAMGWELGNRAFATLAICTVASNLSSIARVAEALRVSGELDGASVMALCGAPQ